MPSLYFNQNWNNKLSNDCFSTIRLDNPSAFIPNNEFNIVCSLMSAGIIEFKAKIVLYQPFFLDDLSDHVAYMDTGLNAKDTAEILRRIYWKHTLDFKITRLCHIILQRI